MAHCEHTLQTVHQSYLDNADYDLVCSVAKANLYILAIRRLIIFAESSSNQSSSLSFNLSLLVAEKAQAEAWVAANDNGAGGSNVSGNVGGGDLNCIGFAGYER